MSPLKYVMKRPGFPFLFPVIQNNRQNNGDWFILFAKALFHILRIYSKKLKMYGKTGTKLLCSKSRAIFKHASFISDTSTPHRKSMPTGLYRCNWFFLPEGFQNQAFSPRLPEEFPGRSMRHYPCTKAFPLRKCIVNILSPHIYGNREISIRDFTFSKKIPLFLFFCSRSRSVLRPFISTRYPERILTRTVVRMVQSSDGKPTLYLV